MSEYTINPHFDELKLAINAPKTRKQAFKRLELMLSIKDGRIAELAKLFTFKLDFTRESLVRMEQEVFTLDALKRCSERDEKYNRLKLTREVDSIIEDIKYYLGDTIIRANPDLYWSIHDFDKSFNGYFKIGVTGPSFCEDTRYVNSVNMMYQPFYSYINNTPYNDRNPNPLTSQFDRIVIPSLERKQARERAE